MNCLQDLPTNPSIVKVEISLPLPLIQSLYGIFSYLKELFSFYLGFLNSTIQACKLLCNKNISEDAFSLVYDSLKGQLSKLSFYVNMGELLGLVVILKCYLILLLFSGSGIGRVLSWASLIRRFHLPILKLIFGSWICEGPYIWKI